MISVSRWIVPFVLAAGFGVAAMAPAHAQDAQLARVIVDVADVIFRGGSPYYRHGQDGYDDRLIVTRDRYGRPVYHREAPRHLRGGPPYGNAYGYHRNGPGQGKVKCDDRGRCKIKGKRGKSHYYDASYDRRHDQNRYGRYDRYDGRYSDRRDDRRRGDDD